ncbi:MULTISPECIES: hypothetical protein [unclassified Streptomyces]|uniref:hypothetical protein n=1 Tax=unclassified Streptomyces TaxID=2593676 RepID=UPI003BB70E61
MTQRSQQSHLQPPEEARRKAYAKPAMFQQGDVARATAGGPGEVGGAFPREALAR